MKGKVSFYYNAPKVAQIKSRLNLGTGEDSKSKEFTAKMREIVSESLSEVLNEQILNIRSKAIAKFQALGYEVKSPKHAADLANPLNSFFDIITSTTPFPAEEGENSSDDAQATDDPEAKQPAAKPEAKQPATKKPAAKQEDDEFTD